MKVMQQKYDELTGAIGGLFGGFGAIHVMGITWQTFYSNAGQLVWVAFMALVTGGMGVLGKHIVTNWLKRKK